MLITLYLIAIVLANLSATWFGAGVSIVNAFLFIGLDLTTRDALHEKWQGRQLWLKMFALIATGSILSAVLNWQALPIAIASFTAFALAGIADAITYQVLGDRSRLIKMNGSNIISSGVDSIVFPLIAFGFPMLWGIVAGQFVAKIAGGFLWSLVLKND